MAETYKDIKRQLDNFTWGNPVECEYFEHSAGCEGCPAEGAYCDRKMVLHLAKRVRKATKREFNIKAIKSLGFPSVGKDTRVAELERDLATVISQRDQTNDTLKREREVWYARQDAYEKVLEVRNERIEELEKELRDAHLAVDLGVSDDVGCGDELRDAITAVIDEYRKTLVKIGCLLGYDDGDLPMLPEFLLGELDKRLMPEGMEWPRFDDGKQITCDDAPEDIAAVCLAIDGSCYSLHYDMPDDERMCIYEVSERVKRSATEVLGADGLPIKVGETVYGTGREQDVYTVVSPFGEIARGRFTVECKDSTGDECMVDPSQLTHTKPDTQERIDDDATLHPEVYCVYILHIESSELGDYSECTEAMALDLLRRQRELCANGGE